MTHYLDGNSHLVFVSNGINPRGCGPWLIARRNHFPSGMHRVKAIKGDASGGLFRSMEEAQRALDAYAADKQWRTATEDDLRGYGLTLETTETPTLELTLGGSEQLRLEELEHVIRDGMERFVQVGGALLEIHDRKLYRATHQTFRDYCRERWGFSDRHGRRLIAAAEVAAEIEVSVGPTGPTPDNERQLRQLQQLPREDRVEAWNDAVQDAGGDPPTHVHVDNAVSRRLGRPERQPAARVHHMRPAVSSDGVRMAHAAVSRSVLAGELPRPETLECQHCGHVASVSGMPHVYHHHCGYQPEHYLDVVALCHSCHVKAHMNGSATAAARVEDQEQAPHPDPEAQAPYEPRQPESQPETLEPLVVDWRPSLEQAALIGREVVNIATGERHSIRSVAVQLVLSNGVRIWTESQSAWQLVSKPEPVTPMCLRVRPGMRLRSRNLPDWLYEVLTVDQSHGVCSVRHIETKDGRIPEDETEDYDVGLGSIESMFEVVE